jgi:hypothetical protein
MQRKEEATLVQNVKEYYIIKENKMKKKYWREVTFENGVVAELSTDGHLYRFKADDIVPLLKDLPKDKYGWYFNDTKDRYCAEWAIKEGYIVVNPSKVVVLFGMPVIW